MNIDFNCDLYFIEFKYFEIFFFHQQSKIV